MIKSQRMHQNQIKLKITIFTQNQGIISITKNPIMYQNLEEESYFKIFLSKGFLSNVFSLNYEEEILFSEITFLMIRLKFKLSVFEN